MKRGKFVIGAFGQSNMLRRSPHPTWDVPPNLYIWDNDAFFLGKAFVKPAPDLMNTAWAFAAKAAKERPNDDVYVIVVARGGTPIAHWLPNPPSPDLYSPTKMNVEAALAAIGADKIDVCLWWHGESDVEDSEFYDIKFETLISDRFHKEVWFPATTPIVIFGIVNSAIGQHYRYGLFARTLIRCASRSPSHRFYFHTASVLPKTFWDDALHASGRGYARAGAFAWLVYKSCSHPIGRTINMIIRRYIRRKVIRGKA